MPTQVLLGILPRIQAPKLASIELPSLKKVRYRRTHGPRQCRLSDLPISDDLQIVNSSWAFCRREAALGWWLRTQDAYPCSSVEALLLSPMKHRRDGRPTLDAELSPWGTQRAPSCPAVWPYGRAIQPPASWSAVLALVKWMTHGGAGGAYLSPRSPGELAPATRYGGSRLHKSCRWRPRWGLSKKHQVSSIGKPLASLAAVAGHSRSKFTDCDCAASNWRASLPLFRLGGKQTAASHIELLGKRARYCPTAALRLTIWREKLKDNRQSRAEIR